MQKRVEQFWRDTISSDVETRVKLRRPPPAKALENDRALLDQDCAVVPKQYTTGHGHNTKSGKNVAQMDGTHHPSQRALVHQHASAFCLERKL
jgi:hypothetical protein